MITYLTLLAVIILFFSLPKQGEYNKTSKENTLNAIEASNSFLYRSMVAQNQVINDVIDDMLADPLWLDIINEINNQ